MLLATCSKKTDDAIRHTRPHNVNEGRFCPTDSSRDTVLRPRPLEHPCWTRCSLRRLSPSPSNNSPLCTYPLTRTPCLELASAPGPPIMSLVPNPAVVPEHGAQSLYRVLSLSLLPPLWHSPAFETCPGTAPASSVVTKCPGDVNDRCSRPTCRYEHMRCAARSLGSTPTVLSEFTSSCSM